MTSARLTGAPQAGERVSASVPEPRRVTVQIDDSGFRNEYAAASHSELTRKQALTVTLPTELQLRVVTSREEV